MEGDPRTRAIIGAAMEVHRTLGCGFLEPVYQDALSIEFKLRSIPFDKEVELPVSYKGTVLKARYRVDFICFKAIVVEIKALSRMAGVEESQVINYLKAIGQPIGLLINFGKSSLEVKRLIKT